jgi:nicotinamidase-related amidase
MDEHMDLALYSAPAQLPNIDLVRGATCLLLIDLQYLDAHPDWGIGKKAQLQGRSEQLDYYFQRLRAVTLPAVQALLSAFRAQGLPVIHAHVESRSKDGREVGWRHKHLGLVVPAGSKESQFLPEAAPQLGEIIVGKTTSGTFASTDLDLMLHNMGVEILVVGGVTTNNCVESTIREAADRGYRVIMVDEATATFTPELQAAAIKNVDRNFGVVRTVGDVAEELAKL